jgi:L-ascorbate metabolism protein UlaG (beta-lactamase superfamily)
LDSSTGYPNFDKYNNIPIMKILSIIFLFPILCGLFYFTPKTTMAQGTFEKDIIKTSAGNLEITFLGHASMIFSINDKIIHIDPFSSVADYNRLPKADLILITHEHGDHLDLRALSLILKQNTQIICTEKCAPSLSNGIIMKNGDTRAFDGITMEAVPAYNVKNGPGAGQVYHPKGQGNGYILTIGDKRIYIAGDTENTPEMKALKNIDVAFLPMNLPYTMTPEMVADAVLAFKPKILYPYHYGETKTQTLLDLLKNEKEIEVRIRKMK